MRAEQLSRQFFLPLPRELRCTMQQLHTESKTEKNKDHSASAVPVSACVCRCCATLNLFMTMISAYLCPASALLLPNHLAIRVPYFLVSAAQCTRYHHLHHLLQITSRPCACHPSHLIAYSSPSSSSSPSTIKEASDTRTTLTSSSVQHYRRRILDQPTDACLF